MRWRAGDACHVEPLCRRLGRDWTGIGPRVPGSVRSIARGRDRTMRTGGERGWAMKRAIAGFHLDGEGDWVADLDCGHGQHVRHRPPFVNRPWVVSDTGREAMLGTGLDCVCCDRMEWPDGLVAYRRTPEFDETTTPAGLKSEHATKRGVWARITREFRCAPLSGGCSDSLLLPSRPVVERGDRSAGSASRGARGAGAVLRRVLADGAVRRGLRETGITVGDRGWRPPAGHQSG